MLPVGMNRLLECGGSWLHLQIQKSPASGRLPGDLGSPVDGDPVGGLFSTGEKQMDPFPLAPALQVLDAGIGLFEPLSHRQQLSRGRARFHPVAHLQQQIQLRYKSRCDIVRGEGPDLSTLARCLGREPCGMRRVRWRHREAATGQEVPR